MSEQTSGSQFRLVVLLLAIGVLPSVGVGASVAMIGIIFSLQFAWLAPLIGAVCGLMVRFMSPGASVAKCSVAAILAAVGFGIGAIVRGGLKIAIELAESPSVVLSNMDWSLAHYLLMASLRSDRWVSLVVTVVLAFLLVKVEIKSKSGQQTA